MTFNEKGEFIRRIPSDPGPRSSPAPGPSREIPSPPAVRAARARLSSRAIPQRRQTDPRPEERSSHWDELGAILLALLALALLAGLVWAVITFQRWIVVGLVFWAIHSVSSRFR